MDSDRTIAALRAYGAEISEAEVARALARLADLTTRDALVVRALAQGLVGKLLDRPMTVLERHADAASMTHVLRRLFQLEAGAEPPG